MCGTGQACSPKNFLFSNTEAWRLHSPENRHSQSVRIFYLIWRWSWAVFFTTFLVLSGALNQSWYNGEGNRVKWFIYLTNWSFLAFCLSLIINAVVSTIGFNSKDAGNIRWYMKTNWMMYELASSVALMVTLLFWGLIYSSSYILEVDTVINHGVNGVFVLLDIWVTAMSISILHFYIPAIFGVAYLIFSIVYDLLGGANALDRPYIYRVVDWSDGATYPAIYSVGAVVAIIVIHLILFGLHKFRIFLYSKCRHDATVPITSQINDNPKYASVELTEY